jgi:hypothetical protein
MRTIPSYFVRVFLFGLVFVFLEVGIKLFGGGEISLNFIVLSLTGGILIAVLLAWMLAQTSLKRLDLILVVWLALFVIERFSNMLEGYFFTNVFPSVSLFTSTVLISLLTTLIEAIMAGVLFLPEYHDKRIISELSNYFKEKTKASWIWRIIMASITYYPIYLFFGFLIFPFVMPYYINSSLLKIPPFTIIIPLELLRGFLYVVALLPIFAVMKANRRTLSVVIASFLYIPGALVPLTIQSSLPANIVPFHLVEILADSIVYGLIITYLLGRTSG